MKKLTSVKFDEEMLKKAHEAQINVSALANDALINKLRSGHFNIQCMRCPLRVSDIFLCRERQLLLCPQCNTDFDMSKCPCDKRGEHMHIRIPGYEGQNERFVDEVLAIDKKAHPQPSNT